MSEVDWSFAPRKATHYGGGSFWRFQGNGHGWEKFCGGKFVFVNTLDIPHMFIDCEERPKEWPTETRIDNIGRNRTEDDMGHYDEQREKHEAKQVTKWTSIHYESFYELTAEDVKAGKIRVDPYFVSMAWKLGQKDDTGVLFHQLKTISRFGEKHDVEREIRALYNQVLCLAKLMRVELK